MWGIVSLLVPLSSYDKSNCLWTSLWGFYYTGI